MQIHLYISVNKIEYTYTLISNESIKTWYVYFGGQATPTRDMEMILSSVRCSDIIKYLNSKV